MSGLFVGSMGAMRSRRRCGSNRRLAVSATPSIGAQAEYLLVPNAQANLAKIPDELSDEQVVLLADIASTGFSGAESANIRIGDTVVVFAQGPSGFVRRQARN
jgi:threonine dehydrogenase-like Zn-dependent dehydrogenase